MIATAEEDAGEPLWLCVCGEAVESDGCCPECSNEPPTVPMWEEEEGL